MDTDGYIKTEIQGRTVEVFAAGKQGIPAVYLCTFQSMGAETLQALQGMQCPDCTLVAISNLDWNRDMAPWDIPAIYPGDTPCTGGADEFLDLLVHEIIPFVEARTGAPAYRALTGYSLAGLLAVYAMYNCTAFTRFASMSGSLWFPGLPEYISSRDMAVRPECIYFSLGDKECRTRNRYLKVVQTNTQAIYERYRDMGIRTTFVLNPGNHYVNHIQRTADGIYWILTQ